MLPRQRLSKPVGKTMGNQNYDSQSVNENLSMVNRHKLPEIITGSHKKSASISKEQRSKRILPIFSKFTETPQSETSSL